MTVIKSLIFLLITLSISCSPGATHADEALSVQGRKPIWWLQAEQEAKSNGYDILSVKQVKALCDSGVDLLLLDVRPDYEYHLGHLPGAINLEFHLGDRFKLAPERKEKLLNILGPDKSRQIIIYCRSYSCLRSSIAADWAVRLGYSNIQRMLVGYQGWQEVFNQVQIEEAEEQLLKAGDYFPQCQLMLLNARTDRKYLGLKHRERDISLDDIDSKYLLVEIYNEFCTGCIAEIKNYKTFFHRFRDDRKLSQRIRIIGIGAGSSKRKVVKFRKKHQIPFPLFSDNEWSLFSCLGRPALPTSYLLKREPDGRIKIIFVQNGHIEEIENWMDQISMMIQE